MPYPKQLTDLSIVWINTFLFTLYRQFPMIRNLRKSYVVPVVGHSQKQIIANMAHMANMTIPVEMAAPPT